MGSVSLQGAGRGKPFTASAEPADCFAQLIDVGVLGAREQAGVRCGGGVVRGAEVVAHWC